LPRQARKKSPSGIYHIIMRGINRQSIFEDEEDKRKLIDVFARYKEISCYRLFAYCLMDNHVHILIQEQKEPIAMIIKRVSASYVLWFNRKYDRCGHLFQERFKSETVDTDSYFLTVLRYIHQNPVKAKIAGDVSEYKWSSYCEYMGKGHIVDRGYVLEMFSNIASDAIKLFEKYSQEKNTDICLEIEEGKANISDERLREIVTQRFGIEAIRISFDNRERQDAILKELKMIDGASIRQIARITGLSPKRVWKA
jgi:putative transposase